MSKVWIFICFLTLPAQAQQGSSPASTSNDGHYDSLRTVLELMYETDQGIRKELMAAMQSESSSVGNIILKMNQTDSLNQIEIKKILNRYGWLERSRIGEKASNALFYVVQHADLPLMEQYYDSLKLLSEKQEASPVHAAMMLDRMRMYQGKKQIYGTQATNLLRTDGISVIWPVEDPDRVNVLRKEVGFKATIEESAAGMNAIYNADEPLPENDVWK